MLNFLIVDNIIKNALIEDVSNGDISTESVVPSNSRCKIDLAAKEDGIIAGLDVFERVFKLLSHSYGCEFEATFYKKDGDKFLNKDKIGELLGDTQIILSGERVALDLLGKMSGIATSTNIATLLLIILKQKS